MMSAPELLNTHSYLHVVLHAEANQYTNLVTMRCIHPCNKDLFELCCLAMDHEGLRMSSFAHDMVHVYKCLRRELHHVRLYCTENLVLSTVTIRRPHNCLK